ncbi:MAG: DUF115 domain-containing protein [Anaerolineales bacterium]|nr:MAG: DUF115 domain-containing protein [Anaerolineales bacterium]
MKRFTLHEMSIMRLFGGAVRRVRDLSHSVAWNNPFIANRNRKYLSNYSDVHTAQRCFILANGPSLSRMDLSPLRNEITFGLNRIYLLFDRLEFLPTYYVCVNELVLAQFSREISGLSMPKFLNWGSRHVFDLNDPSVGFVRLLLTLRDGFQSDIRKPLYSGGTVTYVALQIAYSMGFSEVILVGLDHSFQDKGVPNATVTQKSDVDNNHFHPDYFPKGVKWQLPDLRRSELAYKIADNFYRANGRLVRDATLGGKCPVFQRVEYDKLF